MSQKLLPRDGCHQKGGHRAHQAARIKVNAPHSCPEHCAPLDFPQIDFLHSWEEAATSSLCSAALLLITLCLFRTARGLAQRSPFQTPSLLPRILVFPRASPLAPAPWGSPWGSYPPPWFRLPDSESVLTGQIRWALQLHISAYLLDISAGWPPATSLSIPLRPAPSLMFPLSAVGTILHTLS